MAGTGCRSAGGRHLGWTAGRSLPGLVGALRRLGRGEALTVAEHAVAVERAFATPYELANALDELGHLVRDTDPERARALHHEALGLRVGHGMTTCYVDSLEALAWLASDQGRHAEAVRLLATADTARPRLHRPRPAVDDEAYVASLSAIRDAIAPDAFDQATERSVAELVADGRSNPTLPASSTCPAPPSRRTCHTSTASSV